MKTFVSCPKNSIFDTFFTPENIRLAESLGEVIWNESNAQMTQEEVAERIGDSDVYVTLWGSPRLDKAILDRAPNLKILAHLGGTVVPFVSDAMWDRGIRVLSGNGFFAESVAEGTVAYILASLREIPRYTYQLQKEQRWSNASTRTRGLLGKTVGLVSYGAIAKNVVRMLAPFRVKIMVYDIKPLPQEDVAKYGLVQASLEEIFSQCDVISLHTPLFDQTYHMIGKDLLSLIRKDAVFVNTARGAVVDQKALEQELGTGRFQAILDVYEKEPPEKDCLFYQLDNVLMMPHMGGPTTDLRKDITRALLLESAAYLEKGEPLRNEICRARAEIMSKN